MVRVIKPGKVPPKIVTCDSCGAVLQYMELDIYNETERTVRSLTRKSYVKCPLCTNYILINTHLLNKDGE